MSHRNLVYGLLMFAMILTTSVTFADNRQFFYPMGWEVTEAHDPRSLAPRPTSCSTAACPPAEIPRCGNPKAWTAVSRMPPVRIVVYDPVSNSFGYIAPCASDPTLKDDIPNAKNMEMDDRYRLVLTTQKIRLLIMPYNPADGDLTLEVKPGNGVEYELVPAGSKKTESSSAQETGTSAKGKGTEAVPGSAAKTPEAQAIISKKPDVSNAFSAQIQSFLSLSEKTSGLSNRDLLFQESPTDKKDAWQYEMVELETAIESYRESAAKIKVNLSTMIETPSSEFAGVAKDYLAKATNELNSNPNGFTLAADVPFEAVIEEAKRRTCILTKAAKEVQDLIDSGAKGANSANGIQAAFDGAGADVAQSSIILDAIDDRYSRADALAGTDPKWKAQKDNYKSTIKKLHDLQASLEKQIGDDKKVLGDLRKNIHADVVPITDASTQIQRFDYPPLHDGESVTFAVHRSTAKDGVTREPGHANIIELRSTSVDVFRFGMGVAYSTLRNPTFKPGPEQTTAAGKVKQILFDDQGNGAPLIGAFIHNNWGRKSAFLSPTTQERFLPTVSVGLPVVAKSDHAFDQVLFGLNWELTPGVDLSIGRHWGKVTALQGKKVGDAIPSNEDIAFYQTKRTARAWYFGVVLNSEIFKTLTGGRVSQ